MALARRCAPERTLRWCFGTAPPRRYCDFVARQVGSPDGLIPPRPPLTRYKQELAVQAEQQEAAAAAGMQPVGPVAKVGGGVCVWGGGGRCGAARAPHCCSCCSWIQH